MDSRAPLRDLDTSCNSSYFLDHDKTDTQPDKSTGETIPFTKGGAMGESTWEPERETSFGGGKAQKRRLTNSYINSLHKKLSEPYQQASCKTHYDYFRQEGKQLYFKGKDEPLTNQDGSIRIIKQLKKTF